MVKRISLITILLMILSFGLVSESKAVSSPTGKVYLLVIDKLSIDDLNRADTPHLFQLIQDGSVGVQSNRTLGSGSSEDGALTMGAGNLAQAGALHLLAYNANTIVPGRSQSAEEYYHNLTGNQAGKSAVLLVNLPELQQLQAQAQVNTQLGALGEVLRKNGQKACVIGNGDINGELSRMGTALGMDARGRVALGDVGPNTVQKVKNSYITSQTNYRYIANNLTSLSNGAQLVVLELSNLSRLEKADQATPSVAAAERKKLLYQLDEFVGSILPQIAANDLLLVVSPSAPAAQVELKNTFTPVIIKGPGYSKGALYSPATRRDYIVANTDIAPTILQFLNLPVPNTVMVGRPVSSVIGDSGNLQTVQELGTHTALVNRLRAPLVKGYVVLQIMVIILALLAILGWPALRRYVIPTVCSLVVIPLVFLLSSVLPWTKEWQYITSVIIISAVLTWLGYLMTRNQPYKIFLLVSLITLVVLDLDILTGTYLIQNSVLGYDPMSGARYYGIGNEYLGILLGASIITGVGLYRRLPARWAALIVGVFFVVQSWLVAAPTMGAQTDGVITVPLAFAVTLVLLANWKVGWKAAVSVLVLIMLLVGGLAAYELSRPVAQQTHVGRAAAEIVQGGVGQALTIISRKVGMNIKLIRYTIWSRVFMVILVSLGVLLFYPAGAMLRIKENYPYLFKGFAGIMTGAVVGGLINDSGIVAAATTSIYMVTPVLLLIVKDNLIHPVTHPTVQAD